MGIVTYLPDAIADLHRIWDYVADKSQSMEVADRLIDAIDDAASTYAGQPHLGIPRPELANDVRCFPVGSYIVFYLANRQRDRGDPGHPRFQGHSCPISAMNGRRLRFVPPLRYGGSRMTPQLAVKVRPRTGHVSAWI